MALALLAAVAGIPCRSMAAQDCAAPTPSLIAPFTSYELTPFAEGLTAARATGGPPELLTIDSGEYTGTPGISLLGLPGDGSLICLGHATCAPGAVAVAAGQLNADSQPDLVAAHDSGFLSVLAGLVGGEFEPPTTFATGADPAALVVARFDPGLRADVAVAGSGGITVHLNDGSGGLLPGVGYALAGGADELVATDVDHNGRTDLLLSVSGTSMVRSLIGNGDGTFHWGASWSVGAHTSLSLADVDGDGRQDLLVLNPSPGQVQIRLGTATGFGASIVVPAGDGVAAVASFDADGDGRLDLAMSNTEGVAVARNLGNGQFAAAVSHIAGSTPGALVPVDANGDEWGDLAVLSGDDTARPSVNLLWGGPGGVLGLHRFVATSPEPRGVFVADFDLDGYNDLVIACGAAIDFFPGLSDGWLGTRVSTLAPGETPYNFATGDVNGDGRPDLVAQTYSSLVTRLGGPGGGFGPGILTALPGGSTWGLALADFDADGHVDVVLAQSLYSGGISIMDGLGDGTFAPAVVVPNSGPAASVTAGDFNGDGRMDIALGALPRYAALLLNQSGGTFSFASSIQVGGEPDRITAGDLNGDGDLDLVVGTPIACGAFECFDVDQVTVAMGNGQGGLTDGAYHFAGTGDLAIGDADSDGVPDLASTDAVLDAVFVLHGEPGGGVGPRLGYGTGHSPAGVAIGDLTRDGRNEIVIADAGSATATILMQGSSVLAAPSAGPANEPRIRLSPNPVSTAVAVGFATTRAGSVDVRVLDLQGRLQRSLFSGESSAGPRELRWDLRNEGGSRVPPGVYFVRVHAPGLDGSRRVIVIGG